MMFSVIVPAYNEGAIIKESLLKIRETLSSTVDSFEILAVDDGSSDNTKEEILKASAENPEIIYAGYEKNRGKKKEDGREDGWMQGRSSQARR